MTQRDSGCQRTEKRRRLLKKKVMRQKKISEKTGQQGKGFPGAENTGRGAKRKHRKFIPILIAASGILLACYPWISNIINNRQTKSIVRTYERKMQSTSQKDLKKELRKAKIYNRYLQQGSVTITDPFKEVLKGSKPAYRYNRILNSDGSGVMGWLHIPEIGVKLPVYHGTSEEVLEKGIGHVPGTSFPIGGKSTHAVLTGHTGLSKAKLFTDLPELKKGSLFFVHIGQETLAYEVEKIYVIRPEDIGSLKIVKGKDLVTLLTCYPYGVNTHRFCVQGKRIKYKGQDRLQQDKKPVDTQWMQSYRNALLLGLLVAAGIICVQKLASRKAWKI